MTFSESVATCLAKYATFQGRATRSEYWWWALFTTVIGIAVGFATGLVGGLLGGVFKDMGTVVSGLVGLALLIPSLAVLVRRLHDSGRSGWWFWISLVPVIGTIWLLILLVMPTEPATNRYGAPENY